MSCSTENTNSDQSWSRREALELYRIRLHESACYPNNVVEQDHRRVKYRLRSMLGFKTFHNARRVIIGVELAQKIHKRQFAIPITSQSNPAVIWRHVMAA